MGKASKRQRKGNLPKTKPKKAYRDPGKRRNAADFSAKIQNPEENPFEIRINRKKHDNLGRVNKSEKGKPGISRSKAVEKRKATLLNEYKNRNKVNVFADSRIGEKNHNMSLDEKLGKRSAAEKARQYSKKSMFNLPEDTDFLTHKGTPLTNIQRYEKPIDDSDSEDEKLNEDYVSEAHFSGFMKMKEKPETEEEPLTEKSRKEIIDELILNSKRKKFEKAKESEENFQLISQLDEEFKSSEIRNMLFGTLPVAEQPKQAESSKSKNFEDYDKLVKDLHSESKIELAKPKPAVEKPPSEESQKNKLPLLIGASAHVLGEMKVNSFSAVFRILRLNFYVAKMIESKPKFLPELITSLNTILSSYCPHCTAAKAYCIPSYKNINNLLFMENFSCPRSISEIKSVTEYCDSPMDWKSNANEAKYIILNLTLNILSTFVTLWKRLASFSEIFATTLLLVKELQQLCKENDTLLATLNELKSQIEDKTVVSKEVLQTVVERPKPLKLYEPLFEENFDGLRRKKVSKGKQEMSRLNHKVKKEHKSAVREIKKDTSFLAKQQLKDQMAKDAERAQKLKSLLGSLSNQEGECRKLSKKLRRK